MSRAPQKAPRPAKAARPGKPQTGPFRARLMVSLTMIGLLAVAVMLVLIAFEPELRAVDDSGPNALSRSADGFGGLVTLTQTLGIPNIVSRANLPASAHDGVLILTPAAGNDGKDLEDIRFQGPRLIVLPKWRSIPDLRHNGWVRKAGLIEAGRFERGALSRMGQGSVIARRQGKARPQLRRADIPGQPAFWIPGEIDRLQTLTGPQWQPILTDEAGAPVLVRRVHSQIYVLADPDLFNTQGLRSPGTAQAAIAILKAVRANDGPVIFDVTLQGYRRGHNMLRMAFEPPFAGATFCAVIVALLMGFYALARFGPPLTSERALALGKQALVDNSAGLIRMARRQHRMAERYALLCRAVVAKAVGAPRDLNEAELNALLDRLSVQAGLSAFTPMLNEARRAGNPGDLMTVARKLYDWKREMTRERH
jgi:hypothetical protein